jgi:hypothetical protein
MIQTIAPQIEPVNIASLMVLIIILIFMTLQLKQFNNCKLWLLPMLVVIVHSTIFYVVLMLDRGGIIQFNVTYTTWSSILRLHTYITIAAIEATRWSLKRGCNVDR